MEDYKLVFVTTILVLAAIGWPNAFSYPTPIHVHGVEHIEYHPGTTDSNGCHEDGSGGYHCH